MEDFVRIGIPWYQIAFDARLLEFVVENLRQRRGSVRARLNVI